MAKFQINARTQMVIAIFAGAVSFMASSSLPSSINPDAAKAIHEWSALLSTFYIGVITPILLAFTDSSPGPLAPPDPPLVKHAEAEAKVQDALATAAEAKKEVDNTPKV